MRKKRFKVTPERLAVLEFVLLNESHFQAEDLLVQMRQRGIQVSKATIYRTLPLLVQSGLLREVIVGERHAHYEKSLGQRSHDHLICTNCGKIIEFGVRSVDDALTLVCEEHRFSATNRTLEIHGYCVECQSNRPSD